MDDLINSQLAMARRHSPVHSRPLLWLLLLCAIAEAQIFDEEPSDVSVVVGKSVTLTCRVNQAHLQLVAGMNQGDVNAIWFRIQSEGADEVTHEEEGRFFLVGSPEKGVFDLFINHTVTEDTGSSFLCLFNKTTTRSAILTVLPQSWSPVCASNPTKVLVRGQTLQVACTSSGDRRTNLMWQRNGALVEQIHRSVTDKVVSLTHSEEITTSESLTFKCIASLVGKQTSEVCTLGPFDVMGSKSSGVTAYIPYIIVGLLSVVVSLLFLTLLVVVFRHRQCRICQRELPEPQTVLDMSQIKPGGPPPFYIIDAEDLSDDDGDVGVSSSPPPDVVPTYIPTETVTRMSEKRKGKRAPVISGKSKNLQRTRAKSQQVRPSNAAEQAGGAPLRRTLSNSTLQGNIDDRSKDKTVTGKKKLTMSKYGGSSSRANASASKHNKKGTSASSRSTAAKARTRERRPADDDVISQKQLNLDKPSSSSTGSAAATSTKRGGNVHGASDRQQKVQSEPMSDNPIPTTLPRPGMNNLGDNIGGDPGASSSSSRSKPTRSLYKKKPSERNSRPVSQELNNVEDLKHLKIAPKITQAKGGAILSDNATTPRSTSSAAAGSANTSKKGDDKVVYAALNFTKPIGMNIQPEV